MHLLRAPSRFPNPLKATVVQRQDILKTEIFSYGPLEWVWVEACTDLQLSRIRVRQRSGNSQGLYVKNNKRNSLSVFNVRNRVCIYNTL